MWFQIIRYTFVFYSKHQNVPASNTNIGADPRVMNSGMWTQVAPTVIKGGKTE